MAARHTNTKAVCPSIPCHYECLASTVIVNVSWHTSLGNVGNWWKLPTSAVKGSRLQDWQKMLSASWHDSHIGFCSSVTMFKMAKECMTNHCYRLTVKKKSPYVHMWGVYKCVYIYILYYIILNHIILYYIILCNITLYYVILSYTILFYIILYYTILYYIILYYIMQNRVTWHCITLHYLKNYMSYIFPANICQGFVWKDDNSQILQVTLAPPAPPPQLLQLCETSGQHPAPGGIGVANGNGGGCHRRGAYQREDEWALFLPGLEVWNYP